MKGMSLNLPSTGMQVKSGHHAGGKGAMKGEGKKDLQHGKMTKGAVHQKGGYTPMGQ